MDKNISKLLGSLNFVMFGEISIFLFFSKYGEIEEMNVCDNLGDHLVGNIYVKVSVDFKVSSGIFAISLLNKKLHN